MYNDSNRWSYQKNAIEKISRFFSKDEINKGLLVIPTGGGKTLTALRAINELYRTGIISKKVLWISHLRQLNIQTKNVIKKQLRNRKFLLKIKRSACLALQILPKRQWELAIFQMLN